MFKFVVFIALVAAASAQNFRGATNHRLTTDAQVRSYSNDVAADGFQYGVEIDNGISSRAAGDANGNHQGSFGWTSPEGEQIQIQYVADANGYQPSGAALPTPPPIPAAILRSLEYIRTHPNQENNQQFQRRLF